MSEDEEIICKGKELYTHLINQGYSDFETFNSASANIEKLESFLPSSTNTLTTSGGNCPDSSKKDCICISSNDFEQLDTILKSRLLFKEEVDFIETVLANCVIYKAKPKWFWYLSTLAGVISSLALCRKETKYYLSYGFTVTLSVYSLWKSFKENFSTRRCSQIVSHIVLLQNLCSNVQKLFRFLKETETLSGGLVKSQHVGAAVYIPKTKHDEQIKIKEVDLIPSWKTLPHLRKCLLDSLNDVVNILSEACDVLKKMSTDVSYCNVSLSEVRILLAKTDTEHVSLKTLHLLDETYLALQSEYLKLLSISLCPKLWNRALQVKNNSSEIYNLCHSLESKISNISFQLKMQYDINNIYLPTNRTMGTRSMKLDCNEVNSLQIEVHNIFLLMLSMLLRVRNVEDNLENISSHIVNENQNEIKASVSKQFSTLKNDLVSTLRCFDHIYQQIGSGIKNCDNQVGSGKKIEDNDTNNTKTTGIVVGISDFNVNSPDEVFLAISGLNSEEKEFNDDKWFYEKKPQIPMNLLSELSNRLKVRRKYFSEREKVALRRQGLIDFTENLDEKSNSSDEINEDMSRKNVKRNIESSDISDSSDNEESSFKKIPYLKLTKQIRRYKVDSDSECSLSDNESTLENGNVTGNSLAKNHLSLANQAAMKSQLWRNMPEESFSDG